MSAELHAGKFAHPSLRAPITRNAAPTRTQSSWRSAKRALASGSHHLRADPISNAPIATVTRRQSWEPKTWSSAT